MTTLIVAVGAYAAVNQEAFLTEYNLRNLLLATMPLALVSIGQTNALLVGGFDVSVGGADDDVRRDRLVHDAAGLGVVRAAARRARARRRRTGHRRSSTRR